MNTHNNARLTLWGRAELVRRVLEDDEPVAVVAAALHITPGTTYKWLRRFADEGWAGLADRTSRPHRSPRATPPAVVQRILRLRTRRLTGPEIAEELRLPRPRWAACSPGRAWAASRGQARRRDRGTNARHPASWCTSTPRRWIALRRWGIASTGIARRSVAPGAWGRSIELSDLE